MCMEGFCPRASTFKACVNPAHPCCRQEYPVVPRIALWIMTEIAIIGADIQEACTRHTYAPVTSCRARIRIASA